MKNSMRICNFLLFLVVSVSGFQTSFTRTVANRQSLIQMYSTPTKKEVESFRKADFVSAVSERTGMSKKDSEEALKAVLDIIAEEVGKGKKVSLPAFGTFSLKERSARKGRNPQTGEPLEIAASKSPSFSAAKAWKDAVNAKK